MLSAALYDFGASIERRMSPSVRLLGASVVVVVSDIKSSPSRTGAFLPTGIDRLPVREGAAHGNRPAPRSGRRLAACGQGPAAPVSCRRHNPLPAASASITRSPVRACALRSSCGDWALLLSGAASQQGMWPGRHAVRNTPEAPGLIPIGL